MVWLHYESEVGWIIAGGSAGPAGTIDLLLDSGRVSVDAIDPERLVELVVFDNSAAAVTAVRALIGDPAADQVQAGTLSAKVILIPGRAWPHIRELAAAELVAQRHPAAQGLAALDVVRCAAEIADICGTLLRDRAWQALPAVAALGRASAKHPELVDTLPPLDRELMATAIEALTGTLTADGWDGSGGGAIHDLADLLRGAPDDVGILEDSEMSRSQFRQFRGVPTPPSEVSWRVSSDELRPRLGSLAAAAFAGATATGHIPGSIVVHLPLRPDLVTDMPPVVVRVLTWHGKVLGQVPLDVDESPAGIWDGSCRLQVTMPSDLRQLTAADITIDIALAALPPPDADSLRQIARARAARAGKEAVLARRAGRRVAEAEHWRHCAALLYAAGETALAKQAAANARGSGATTVSWVDAVVDRMGKLASRTVEVPAGAPWDDYVEKQRLLVRDLSYAADAVTELVTAREQLADMLLNGNEDDLDEAADQLSEALQAAYLIGDETAAARLISRLRELPDSESAS